MTFTLNIRQGIVVSCVTPCGPWPVDYCDIEEAITRIFNSMSGNQFEIEFRQI